MKHLSQKICRICFQPAAQLFQIPGYNNFATCFKCNHIVSTTGVLPVLNGVVYQNIRQDLDTRINSLQHNSVAAVPESNSNLNNSSPINTPIAAAPAPELQQQQTNASDSFTDTKNFMTEGAAMSLEKGFQQIDVIFNEEGSCPLCSKTFSRKSSLLTHVRNHSAERKFVCNYCHKGFTQAANLRNHERIHTNDRPYMCIDCGKSFTQITNLNNHRRLHTGERPFVCIESECGRSFAQVTNLNNHMKTHHKVQQYCCNQCPKKFTQVTSLNQHLQLHAGITGYYCPRCPEKEFKQQSQLHTHMKSHGLAFPYECEKCDEKFLQQAHLEQHNKVHDEFKFKCELCPSSFNQDALLKKHLQRHAEGRYLTCPVATCNQAFAVKQHLSKHLLTRHAHSELPPPKRSKKQSQPAHIIAPHNNTPISAPSPLTTTPHRGRPKKKTTYMSEVSQAITQNLKFHHPNVHHLVGNTPIEMPIQHMYTGQI